MRILYIIPEFGISGGGLSTYYDFLIPAVRNQGHAVDILLTDAGSTLCHHLGVTRLSFDLVNKYQARLGVFSLWPNYQRFLAIAWAAWEQVKGGEGYDIVETTDWGWLFVPWLAQASPVPVLVQMHASEGQISFLESFAGEELGVFLANEIERNVLRYADHLQTYSRQNQDYWKVALNRAVSCILPVWKKTAKESEPVDVSSLGSVSFDALVVGRLQSWKGPAVLCEALERLGDKAPKVLWVGRDMSYQNREQKMSDFLKAKYPRIWGEKFIHLSNQPRSVVTYLQDRARFILVPSIWDTFNFTLIEGMASGKVVLASSGSGASELIEHGVNGFVFDKNSSTELADKIAACQCLADRERERIGLAARETIAKELAAEKLIPERLKVYEDMLKNKVSKPSLDQWVIDLVSPWRQTETTAAFLDKLPLRVLLQYCFQRSFKKLLPIG